MADKLRRMKDRASRMYAEGRLQEALELYSRILEEDERELGCRIKVGDIHRRLGNPEEAVEAYAAVATRYAEDGLLLKAIAVCKLILVADPDHNATQVMLAELYARRRGGASSEVPALPVNEPAAPKAVLSAWPGGMPAHTEMTAREQGPPAILSAWPMSQPVIVERPKDAAASNGLEESTFEIEVSEHFLEESMLEGASTRGLTTTGFEDSIEISVESIDGSVELSDVPVEEAASEPVSEETFPVAVQVPASLIESSSEPPYAAKDAPPLIPLFSDLPKKAFVEILVRMTMHQLRRGEVIIREGEEGDSFYIVASGLVSVSRKDDKGKEVILAHLGEGAFFGEMALLQDGVRTATVRVEDDAQVFEISRQLLDEVTTQYATVASAVKNFYRQRLLATAMATHSLFAPFSPEERRALMEQFKSRSFQPGEIILEEGKKGNGLYLLLHGRVQVTKLMGDGEPVELAELSSGDLFGEMSLLTGQPTNATVTALEDAWVLRLSKKRFDELVLSNGAVLAMIGQLNDERSEENEKVLSHQLDARGAVLV